MQKQDTPPIALYARSAATTQGEPGDIAPQLDALRQCAAREGLTIVDSYSDAPCAGNLPLQERPAGARLLADALSGRFGRVLVTSLDRLARDTEAVIAAQTVLADGGCRVAIVEDGRAFDTETSEHGRGLTITKQWPVRPTDEEQQRVTEALINLLSRSEDTPS